MSIELAVDQFGEQRQQQPRQQQAEGGGDQRDQHRLGEELRDQPAGRRAEHLAHGDLALAPHGAHRGQVDVVGGGQQQDHQRDRAPGRRSRAGRHGRCCPASRRCRRRSTCRAGRRGARRAPSCRPALAPFAAAKLRHQRRAVDRRLQGLFERRGGGAGPELHVDPAADPAPVAHHVLAIAVGPGAGAHAGQRLVEDGAVGRADRAAARRPGRRRRRSSPVRPAPRRGRTGAAPRRWSARCCPAALSAACRSPSSARTPNIGRSPG